MNREAERKEGELSQDKGRAREKKQNHLFGNSGDGFSVGSETDVEDEVGGIGRPKPTEVLLGHLKVPRFLL